MLKSSKYQLFVKTRTYIKYKTVKYMKHMILKELYNSGTTLAQKIVLNEFVLKI